MIHVKCYLSYLYELLIKQHNVDISNCRLLSLCSGVNMALCDSDWQLHLPVAEFQ